MMKSNKALARKILCGLLTAGVLGVSGSALAENINVTTEAIKDDKAVISVGIGEMFDNAGKVEASESITVNGGFFKNTGDVDTKVLDIKGHTSDQDEIGGTIKATEKIVYRGIAGNLLERTLKAQ